MLRNSNKRRKPTELARTDRLGVIQRMSEEPVIVLAKLKPDRIKYIRDIKDNKKSFYRYLGD